MWGWEGKVLLKKRLVNDKKAEGAMKLTHTLTNLVPLVHWSVVLKGILTLSLFRSCCL